MDSEKRVEKIAYEIAIAHGETGVTRALIDDIAAAIRTARREGMEAAARIADQRANMFPNPETSLIGSTALSIATAIRDASQREGKDAE